MRREKLFLLITLILSVTISACSDDNNSINEEKENFNEQETEANIDKIRFMEVADKLFELKKDDKDSVVSFAPKHGKVLESATPSAYTIGLKENKEAFDWFVTHCVPMNERDSVASLNTNVYTINFGEYGSIVYDSESSAARYGLITLNLNIDCTQKSIEIIPLSMWPENESSLFYVGDLVLDVTDNMYYICLRACEGGSRGILLSFNDEWRDKPEYFLEEFKDWWKTAKMPKGPSEEAWDALCHWVCGDFENAKAEIKYIISKFSNTGLYCSLIYSLLREPGFENVSCRFPMGRATGDTHYWMCRYVWKLNMSYVYVGNKEIIRSYTSLPHFRKETILSADHSWWKYQSFYTFVHEERFINTDYYDKRFIKKYNANN